MALMTKEQYLSSLRELDHRVFIQGERGSERAGSSHIKTTCHGNGRDLSTG